MSKQVYVTENEISRPAVFGKCCVRDCTNEVSIFYEGMCDECQYDFYRELTEVESKIYDYYYKDPLGLVAVKVVRK